MTNNPPDCFDPAASAAGPETLSAVLAEMREKKGFPVPYAPEGVRAVWREDVSSWADRIEAAAKREGLTSPAPTAPRPFDEAAFDADTAKPSAWDAVPNHVAEVRRMRDGETPGNAAAMREALQHARDAVHIDSALGGAK